MALRRTAVEKANAADPSVRDPPQAPATLDQGSPSATAAAEGRSSLDHPPRNRRTSSLLCTLKQKLHTSTAHRSRGRMKTRPLCRRSTQGAPPPRSRRRRRSGAPTGRGRDREDVIPRRRRRRRLDAAAVNQTLEELVPNLHRQAERHRSRTHPRARGPPEAEGNGDLAGGSTGRSPFASLSCSREKRGGSSREERVGDGVQCQIDT
jgi:hypothetical protein